MNNTSELERWIAVMQAAKDGKPIEVRTRSCELTWGTSCDPDWNWAQYDYRVKVEPEKITLWRWFLNGKPYLPWSAVPTVE